MRNIGKAKHPSKTDLRMTAKLGCFCLFHTERLMLLLFGWTDGDHHNVTKKDALIGALQWETFCGQTWQTGMLNREKLKNRQRSKKENYENNIYAEKWNVGVGDFFLANNPYLTGSLSLNFDCCALRDSELSKLQYKCFAPMGFTTSTNRPKHSVGFTCDYWQVRALITSLRHRSSTEWVTECGSVCACVFQGTSCDWMKLQWK